MKGSDKVIEDTLRERQRGYPQRQSLLAANGRLKVENQSVSGLRGYLPMPFRGCFRGESVIQRITLVRRKTHQVSNQTRVYLYFEP